MTDPNTIYLIGPKGDPGQDAEPVNYTVVNSMVNQILVSNPALKGVKGDQGNSATDAQVSAAVQAYLSANEEVFKGADGISPVLDYSQIITDIEAWMQTDAIKPIFTGDAANVDTSALQTSIINAIKVYMDENPNQFKGVDGTSPSINYTTVIEGIKTWMTSSPEVISIFRGATGNAGLPAPAPDPIDYNIVKNDVDSYLSANLSALVSPTIISNAFVDSSGNLISGLSTAISTSTSTYLAANPPSGASQGQVDGWISAYLSSNPQGLTSDQVNTAIGAYLVANPQGLTSDQVNTAIGAYLVANPQGLTSSQVNTLIAAYLVANPINSLTLESLTPLLTELQVAFTINYNKLHYDFTRANNSFMYTLVPSGSYDASTQWKVEAWVYYISGSGVGTNAYATIMDNRAFQNWTNTGFMVLNIWDDKVACVSPDGTSLSDFGRDATLTVPKNQWAHIAWQCSPSTGLMTFINGVLAAQTGFKPPWNNSSGNLCFGATVDMQQGDFYHLNGSISQLLFRAGASVEQYPAGGFTPPPNLTDAAAGKTDVVYLMQHGFANLIQPAGCVVLETSS